MAKFVLIDMNQGDLFTEEFDSLYDAIRRADYLWTHYTPREQRKRQAFYVIESCNPDPDAADHLDGTIKYHYKG